PRDPGAVHEMERHGAREHGGNHREEGDGEVVADRNRQREGEHADKMHGPDARAHGGGAGGQPPATGLRRWRARHPLDDLEGGVAAQRGHEEGQRHQEWGVGRRKLLAQVGVGGDEPPEEHVGSCDSGALRKPTYSTVRGSPVPSGPRPAYCTCSLVFRKRICGQSSPVLFKCQALRARKTGAPLWSSPMLPWWAWRNFLSCRGSSAST